MSNRMRRLSTLTLRSYIIFGTCSLFSALYRVRLCGVPFGKRLVALRDNHSCHAYRGRPAVPPATKPDARSMSKRVRQHAHKVLCVCFDSFCQPEVERFVGLQSAFIFFPSSTRSAVLNVYSMAAMTLVDFCWLQGQLNHLSFFIEDEGKGVSPRDRSICDETKRNAARRLEVKYALRGFISNRQTVFKCFQPSPRAAPECISQRPPRGPILPATCYPSAKARGRMGNRFLGSRGMVDVFQKDPLR